MLKHRSLTLHKFVSVVSPDLLERYFKSLNVQNTPTGWETLSGEALEQFLARPENAETESLVRQDLERVNDIAGEGVGIVIRAFGRFGLQFDQERTTEENALRLFLDHPRAFDFAWTRFLLHASTSKLSVHAIDRREVNVDEGAVLEMQARVRQWFKGQEKGEQGEVSHFEDDGDDIFLIRHGTYYRALPNWQGEELDVTALRLAVEDVMIYERQTGLLRIKATLTKDRLEYLRLFTSIVVREPELAAEAAETQVFSLEPVQEESFDYGGAGEITRVELVSVRMRLYGLTNPIVEIKSRDVLAAFKYDLGSLTLDSGVLLNARFKFTIQRGTKPPATRTFDVTPPSYSNLPDKRETQLILDYLAQQGVKIR